MQLKKLLTGNDLRSLGKINSVISQIKNQQDFDGLFRYLFEGHRGVVMRAADAIEKITISEPSYLHKHKNEIIGLCHEAGHKELKWHLASLIPRLSLKGKQLSDMCNILKQWINDKDESRIVRVNSLQALFDLAAKHCYRMDDVSKLFDELEKENVPSINARIRNMRRNASPKLQLIM